MDLDAQAIGCRLVEARETRNLKQKVAAARLGMTYVTLSNYERGTRPPSLRHLTKLAELYGVDERWLLRGEDVLPEQDDRIDPVVLSILRDMAPELQGALLMDWWPQLSHLYRDMRRLEDYMEAVNRPRLSDGKGRRGD